MYLFVCSSVFSVLPHCFVSRKCCRRRRFFRGCLVTLVGIPGRFERTRVICMPDARIGPEVHVTSDSVRRCRDYSSIPRIRGYSNPHCATRYTRRGFPTRICWQLTRLCPKRILLNANLTESRLMCDLQSYKNTQYR